MVLKLSNEGRSGSSKAGVRSTALEATRLVGGLFLKGWPRKPSVAAPQEGPKEASSLGNCHLAVGRFC